MCIRDSPSAMPLLERLLLRGHIDRIKPADQDISTCLLYTSDAADEEPKLKPSSSLGGSARELLNSDGRLRKP